MLARKKPVVVVGSINIDLVVNTERIPVEGETLFGQGFQVHPGGKGANQAVAIGRLGYPVQMIGRLGNDAFGDQLRSNLALAGVDIAGVKITEATSGVAMIVVAQSGENSIVITPGANALLSPEDLDANIERIRSAGMVLTQLEIPMETVEYLARICAREDVPLILDPAPAKDLPFGLLKNIAWFTPNETEAAFFIGNADNSADIRHPEAVAGKLLEKGAKGVVLKLGSRGAYLATSEITQSLRPFPVKAIDTTAAGDAFNGAFATGMMLRMGPVESARFAGAAAAISVTRAGAQPSMPVMADVEQFIAAAQRENRPGD
ncbi:MAG: ribokinase [Silvibacterium sp.]